MMSKIKKDVLSIFYVKNHFIYRPNKVITNKILASELADVEALSYEAAKRYLKRIKWYLTESYRLWFQSCLPSVLQDSAVILLDVSDSSKSWIAEAITALRSLANNSTGRLNFIQFNGKSDIYRYS